MKSTDTKQLLEDINAGILANQLGTAVSEAASGVCHHGGKGKVVLELDFKRIGESSQVNILTKLKFVAPTKKGKKTEEITSETPMHVNSDGEVTLFPKNQNNLEFSKKA